MTELKPEQFAARWQGLHFEEKQKKSESPSAKCDVIRNVLSQLQLARCSKLISPSAANFLSLHHADNYGNIVDSPTDQNGLDNFADGALSSLEGKRNESEKWRSSLTMESIKDMECVQNLLKTNKAAHDSIFPAGSENVKLNIGASKKNGKDNIPPKPSVGSSISQMVGDANQANSTVASSANCSSSSTQNKFRFQGSESELSKTSFWNMGTSKNVGAQDRQSVPSNKLYGQVEPYRSKGNSNTTSDRSDFYRRNEPMKRQRSEDQDVFEDENDPPAFSAFKTAREQLVIDQQKKYSRGQGNSVSTSAYGTNKKSLGARRGLNSRFIPPVREKDDDCEGDVLVKKVTSAVLGGKSTSGSGESSDIMDERLKNIEPKMVELITSEIMDHGPPISWDDVAGLEFAKKTIKEIVVWPMLRPDIFTGLRGPPKGLLLFGPPGTGKTLIGKCIASQSKSTFFSISASSLTSKWVGEGEKMVRALFEVSRVHQPAVIFIDEIDSLLSQRSDGEHEASRRIKTEFLVQLDGATTGAEDRILVVGATNRPQEIDEAARRRFVKRLYIPLPESPARRHIVTHLLSQQSHDLSDVDLDQICLSTDGYSGSDMANLCREAAMGPIRSMAFGDIENITAEQVRPISHGDFVDALKQVRASVSDKDLDTYLDWNKQYGSWGIG